MFLPFLSAILGIIAFLPVNFYPVSLIFLVPLFVFFLREQKFWRLILGALIFRLVFLSGTVYYTLEPILWLSAISIILIEPMAVWSIKKTTNKSNYILFTLPFLWTFFDIIQAKYSLMPGYIATAGNALGSSPFLGLANFGGIVSLTFFAAIVNTLVAAIITISPLTRGEKKRGFILAGIIVILISSAYLISQNQLQKNLVSYSNLKNSIRFAAISVSEKFTIEQFDSLKKELAAARVDLVIFPEDITDFPAGKSFSLAQNTAKGLKTDLLAAFDTTRGGARYNSAILFDKQGNIAAQHDKNRLTFIGEYWPFGDWRPLFYDWLKKTDPSIAGYAIFSPENAYHRGNRELLSLATPQGQISFAAPICLEINYPADLAEYKKSGAKFIVNPSSNRWIEKGVGHYLYLINNLKKIEAVWLKIPIISSGVNDYAGIILPDGEARLVDYENSPAMAGLFVGEIRY